MPSSFARVLAKSAPEDLIQQGAVTAVGTDGTVSLRMGDGSTVESAFVLSSYAPASGDLVEVMARNRTSWLVLGSVRTSNPPAAPIQITHSFPFNVTAAAPSVSNPLVLAPSDIQSWRDNEGWSGAEQSNRAAQGAISTRWGYYRGCYFYGPGAFSALSGRTGVSLSIRLHRWSSGGNGGAESIWLAPHTHETQPSDAPYFAAPAVNVGSLAWNGTGTFTLPAEWAQKFCDGVYKGIGHLYLGTADYSIFHGLDTDSLSGQLSVGWS